MSCRPKLCQRLAAQLSHPPPTPLGSNHIWISDELLSEAFNRFFRVSHTSRRYGSNVPGPLEARRRASKRRMGCAVAGASMGPPGGDFGALFGAGTAGDSLENGWSWKPPGLQAHSPKPTTKEPSQWSWSMKPPEPPGEWMRRLEIQDHAETSRLAFEQLLRSHETIEILEKPAITVMIDFLTSAEDEPAARNTIRLIRWLAGRTMNREGWKSVTTLICDKIQLASLQDTELLEVIRALPLALQSVHDGVAHGQLHEMLVTFSATLDTRTTPDQASVQALFEECHKATMSAQDCSLLVDVLRRTIKNNDSSKSICENISSTFWSILIYGNRFVDGTETELLSHLGQAIESLHLDVMNMVLGHSTKLIFDKREEGFSADHVALEWLRCLSRRESFMNDSAQTNAVYTELAKYLRPSQIARHFAVHRVPFVDIARMMLCTWLPNTDLDQLRNSHPQSVVTTSLAARDLRLLRYTPHELTRSALPAILQDFEKLHAEGKNHPWVNLLRSFTRKKVCHEPMLHEIFGFCKAGNRPSHLAHMFQQIRERMAVPASIAVPLVNYFLDSGKPRYALAVFMQEPSVAITDVPRLATACLEDRGTRVRLFDLLARQPGKLPHSEREVYKLAVTQEYVDLVHLIAHDVATSTKLPQSHKTSQAFRTVRACYRWLRDRGATLSPLISRALVHAGITRPIRGRIWVPDERLEYILHVVEQVEGPEVRNRVEEMARYMRSASHDEVLAKRYASANTAWSEESKAFARQTKFRIKEWTKRKPLPTEDGESFWVPMKTAAEESTSPESRDGVGDTTDIWRPVGDGAKNSRRHVLSDRLTETNANRPRRSKSGGTDVTSRSEPTLLDTLMDRT